MQSVLVEFPDLMSKIDEFWTLSAEKLRSIESNYDYSKGSPVFTYDGAYTTRGWTEWTEGFVYGSQLLQFDATGDSEFLEIGRNHTVSRMAKHVTHTGVHDHGFNNVSTYGNLLRLAWAGRYESDEWEREFYRLALKSSGAVQASRWSDVEDGGFIYSFNGPQSLFADTIRSLRVLAVAHSLGHELVGEHDESVSLLKRLLVHAETTARYIVYFGEGRDSYDIRGRVAHEAIFNPNDGKFRCPSTQQGYSPFSTWTRGLAWVVTGYAEELEYVAALTNSPRNADIFDEFGGRERIVGRLREVAQACADFYLENTGSDYIPYWDTGAPGLELVSGWRTKPADPYNDFEPVDSSAAAITAQGLLRLGRFLDDDRYVRAGLTIIDTLLDDPYISRDANHQGLLLHSVYHRPNGWDRIPEGKSIPCGESSMWGDYHLREAVIHLQSIIEEKPSGARRYFTFFDIGDFET